MKKLLLSMMTMLPLLASADVLEINGIGYDVFPGDKTAKVIGKSSGEYSGSIIIPKTITYKNNEYIVTSIGNSAFADYSGLTSITIPNSVESIGSRAFYGTAWLNNQPDGVVYAGKVLYTYKGSMPVGTKISIKDGTLGIAGSAFAECSGLTSITIPNSVTNIGYDAFCDCSGLTSITIPNSVTSIGGYVFSGCSGLTSVTISNSVTNIGDFAFYNCSGLTSVTIPNSVTSIGNSVFAECSGLTSITIPNSVESIGSRAFYGTAWFNNQPNGVVYAGKVLYTYKGSMPVGTKISIKDGTLGIAGYAFARCSGLTSITIPNSVTNIGDFAFFECSGLTSITIPNSVTYIGNDAFNKCSGLTSVIIPNSVTYIGYEAFFKCSGLTSVTIGSGIRYLSDLTFANCPELTNVYCYKEKVLSTFDNPFEGSYIEYATLHVPKGCLDAYKAVEPWKNFKSIVEIVDAKVELSKSKATIEKGKTLTLKATITPSDLSDKSVTWKSSNTKVATVTSSGKVKGVKAGTATITCTSKATGAKATCIVTVVNGLVTLNKTEAYVQKGKTMTLKATVTPKTLKDKTVTWESSNTKIATVTKAGKVKGVKYGTTTITCTSVATGAKATCQVTVGNVVINMSEFTLKKSRAVTLVATVYPTTLTDKSVTWESSNKKVATVTSSGKVKGIKAGTATITCTAVATGLKGTCTVTVLSNSEARSMNGDDDELTDIKELESPAVVEPFDVYDLSGHKVLHQVTSVDGLPDGIYIVNGKKILKKK